MLIVCSTDSDTVAVNLDEIVSLKIETAVDEDDITWFTVVAELKNGSAIALEAFDIEECAADYIRKIAVMANGGDEECVI